MIYYVKGEKMIRVLHVVGGMQQGGTENFIMNIYRNIDRNKIQFDFLVNRKGVFEEEIKNLGGRVYYIPALQNVGQIRYKKKLDEFFKNHKEYKIIHSHLNQVSGLILERAKKANIPIRIAHSHSNRFWYSNNLIKLYKMYLKTKIEKSANYKFACSVDAGKFMFGKNSEFKVINNFIDAKKYIYNEEIRKKVRKQLNIDENIFVIGYVGRFEVAKNPIFALKVFKEFLKLNPNSKFLMIGKGSLKNEVISYIEENNIKDNVIMLEDRNDINELMQAMDYFILSSIYEGLGIVLIEAQAAGLKCIAAKDVIQKEAQITPLLNLLPLEENPKIWANYILETQNYNRENTYSYTVKNGFDIKENINVLEDFYINCLEESKR